LSVTLVVNNIPFDYPEQGEPAPWGEAATGWATEVTKVLNSVSGPSDILESSSTILNNQTTFQNIPGAETIFGKTPVADVTKGIGAYKPSAPGTFLEGPDGGFVVPELGKTVPTTTVPTTTIPTTTVPDKERSLTERIFFKTKPGGGEEFNTGAALAVGVPTLLYGTGAFETEPYERSMFTYNVGYPELYRSRKFYTQDPQTGEVRELPQQDYIPEESAAASVTKEGDRFGPYKRETITLQQGGLATLGHFRDGGVNYLPSKTTHDEDDEDNYMRVNGYVEDGAGNGDKEEDTMLAQLADGEFVTRTDGVLGAGILAGADPKDSKDMRKKGAEFFYEQQKRFKRIYDLLDASRKARAN